MGRLLRERELKRDVLIAVDWAHEEMFNTKVMGWLLCVLEGREPRRSLGDAIVNPFPRNEERDARSRGEQLIEIAHF